MASFVDVLVYKKYLTLVAIWHTICIHYSEGTYSETYWQGAISVFEYTSYRSVRMLEFTVPPLTYKSTWLFQSSKSDKKCDERVISIYIQHGSFPVISPLNETFPDNFNLHRTELFAMNTSTENSTKKYIISEPLPGSWFAVVFIGDYVDDKITQKGLGINCGYSTAGTHVVDILESVQGIITHVDIPLTAKYNADNIYRFHTTEQTWQFTLSISNCSVVDDDHNDTLSNYTGAVPCPMLVLARGLALPQNEPSSHMTNCSETDSDYCSLKVSAPAANDWQYVKFVVQGRIKVTFNLFIHTEECSRYFVTKRTDDNPSVIAEPKVFHSENVTVGPSIDYVVINSSNNDPTNLTGAPMYLPNVDLLDSVPMEITHNITSEDIPKYLLLGKEGNMNKTSQFSRECVRVPELGRFAQSSRAFVIQYQLRIGTQPFPNRIGVEEDEPMVLKIEVKPIQDNGGTLKFAIKMIKDKLTLRDQIGVINACIWKWGIPLGDEGLNCPEDFSVSVNTQDNDTDKIYFPYPEAGSWYITMLSTCYSNSTAQEIVPCQEKLGVLFEVAIYPCVDGGCGDYGRCNEYSSNIFHFSSCACIAKWRGYGCTDGTVASSDEEQLVAALLLTMSNLAFLPAILLGLYRRFFVEALVYAFTMFFSTFYHACDGNRNNLYCMMPYNVMAVADFYGAIMAFWVTLVNMSRLPERLRSFLFMVAALSLIIGVTWDRHSLWTFLVPCAVALAIMAVAWGLQCHSTRSCYPSRRRWLLFLLPGVAMAGIGLIVFAFFETESNYEFTHSSWHACMALCILFLMPPRSINKSVELKHKSDSDTLSLVQRDEAGGDEGHDNPVMSRADTVPSVSLSVQVSRLV